VRIGAAEVVRVNGNGGAFSVDLEYSSKYNCERQLGRSGIGFDKKSNSLSFSRS